MPPALWLGTVCSKESYRLQTSPQLWGCLHYGGIEKLLSAVPIHLPWPFQKILTKQNPTVGATTTTAARLRMLRRDALASCRAQLFAQRYPVKCLKGCQHLGIRSVQCALVTAAMVEPRDWRYPELCLCLSHPLHRAVVSACPCVPTHPVHRE